MNCSIRAPVLLRSPAVRASGLRGGLWSPTEICVDPREAMTTLATYLAEKLGVSIYFGSPVLAVDPPQLHTSTGTWKAQRTVVCTGSDFETLFPELFNASGLTLCKLQMMRTEVQPAEWRLGPILASGLSLRHYPAFTACPSLPLLAARVAEETPALDRWRIHVLASQNGHGEITIGDSHEYGRHANRFDRPEIDQLILHYLGLFTVIPAPKIAQRWHGFYATSNAAEPFVAAPHPDVRIVTGLGGNGMTTAFGLAEEILDDWV